MAYAWNFILPVLETASAYYEDYESEADILHMLLSGTTQVWIISDRDELADIRGIALTEWFNFSRNKVLRVKLFAALELEDYPSRLLTAIEDWGMKQGATRIQVVGRDAWIKLLKEQGYKKESTVLAKEIVSGEA